MIRGHTTLQEVRRIGNKGGGPAIMFAGTRNGAFRCHDTFSRSTDRTGSRTILRARTCRMQRWHFLMPNTRSEACEKRRLRGRSVSNDDRKGSSRADGFVLAVFSGLLKAYPLHAMRRGEYRQAAGPRFGRKLASIRMTPFS